MIDLELRGEMMSSPGYSIGRFTTKSYTLNNLEDPFFGHVHFLIWQIGNAIDFKTLP